MIIYVPAKHTLVYSPPHRCCPSFPSLRWASGTRNVNSWNTPTAACQTPLSVQTGARFPWLAPRTSPAAVAECWAACSSPRCFPSCCCQSLLCPLGPLTHTHHNTPTPVHDVQQNNAAPTGGNTKNTKTKSFTVDTPTVKLQTAQTTGGPVQTV